MAETGGTYSFLDVNATIVGPGINAPLGQGSGVSEGGITVAYAGDFNSLAVGADGTPMNSLHASKAGMITVRLLKTSPTNRVLSNALNAQRAGGSSQWGQNTITITNPQSGDVITGRFCAFKKPSDITYAVEGGHNEWVFDVGKLDERLGSGSPALGAFGF